MASRIVPHPEAFAMTRGQRRPRVEKESHLDFIRRLPCLATGRRLGVQACHIRMGAPALGKPETGMQEKSSDRWTLPLTAAPHAMQHGTGNEQVFWESIGLHEPLVMALVLWGLTGDIDRAEAVIEIFFRSRRR